MDTLSDSYTLRHPATHCYRWKYGRSTFHLTLWSSRTEEPLHFNTTACKRALPPCKYHSNMFDSCRGLACRRKKHPPPYMHRWTWMRMDAATACKTLINLGEHKPFVVHAHGHNFLHVTLHALSSVRWVRLVIVRSCIAHLSGKPHFYPPTTLYNKLFQGVEWCRGACQVVCPWL